MTPESVYRHRWNTAPPLDREALASLPGGVIVVYISPTDLDRPRGKGKRLKPLPVARIDHSRRRLENDHERIRRWWQFEPSDIATWMASPQLAPSGLLGVTGGPRDRWVCGSLKLNPTGWGAVPDDEAPTDPDLTGIVSPPVTPQMLDWRGLRGRRLRPDAVGIRKRLEDGARVFGQGPRQVVDVIVPDGRAH